MNRNVFWAFLALCPLVLLTFIFTMPEYFAKEIIPLISSSDYWLRNWYRDILLFCIFVWLIFLIHSIIKKRFLWLVVIFLVSFPAIPIYWWLNSANET